MESSFPALLPIPRLRLSRNPNPSPYETPGAGPSRDRFQDAAFTAPTDLHKDQANGHDSEEEQYPTPRVTSTATLLAAAETPAARLRALLSRVPTSPATTPMPHPPAHTPSELDSDFESPEDHLTTPSIARESLKDIFSRALREPGNTPVKNNNSRRRNSIDASEVEASPRVERERAKNKGKRRSLSDEEVENPSKSSQRSETSFRSSQAATFDILRERLTNSHTQIQDQHLSEFYDYSIPDGSHDAASILRDLNSSKSTPPVATSTPQQSLRMSVDSQLEFQSNLLEQDSEMQRAIDVFDSYEDSKSQRPVSFPPLRVSNVQPPSQEPTNSILPSSQRSQSSLSLSHSKVPSLDKFRGSPLTRRASEELRSSSRASSSHSGTGHHEDPDRLREREREWNRSKTSVRAHTPDLKYSAGRFPGSGSLMTGKLAGGTLSRRGSAASLRSFDGDSTGGGSIGSQADYHDRISELDKERNAEREREWNKRNSKLSRPLSSLGLHSPTGSERVRTQSLDHPAQPIGPSPGRHLQRHRSFSNSSRASSPSGSVISSQNGQEDSAEEEVVHERERNWNAPRPKWNRHPPASPSRSKDLPSTSHLNSSTGTRMRAESLRTLGTSKGESPSYRGKVASSTLTDSGTGTNLTSTHAPLLQQRSNLSPTTSRSLNHTPRPHSPLPGLNVAREDKGKGDQSQAKSSSNNKAPTPLVPESTTHFGYTFVRNRAQLPPIDFEKELNERSSHMNSRAPSPMPDPSTRPSSHVSASSRLSHIPVRSPKKGKDSHSGLMNGHSNTPAGRAESPSRYLAPPENKSRRQTGEQESEDDGSESLSPERTPTLRTIPPPPVEVLDPTLRSPSPPPHKKKHDNDEIRFQRALGSNHATPTPDNSDPTSINPIPQQELSLPPSPSAQQPLPSPKPLEHSLLSTSPKSSSLTLPRRYKTPSPLPELPDPPSSSEGEEVPRIKRAETPIRDLRADFSSLKTPRPPGAWASTPAPRLDEELTEERERKAENEQTPIRDLRSDLTSMKTPRAPGAWASTPAPHRESTSRAHSFSGDTDTEYESGLATPVASLSRASSLPAQTPAPPGAWMATPAARKSILKVRFNTETPNGEQSLSNAIESSNDFADGIANASWRTENPSADSESSMTNPDPLKSDQPERNSIAEPSMPQSPRSPPRKAASIRVLDAFGREQVEDEKASRVAPETPNTLRNKSGIRVVDAMGRDLDEDAEKPKINETKEDVSSPLNHNEALVRLRGGLSDLAQGLDQLDRASRNIHFDQARFDQLRDETRASKAARQKLKQAISSKGADTNSKYEALQASMKRSKVSVSAAFDRRLSTFQITSWMFWGAVALQLILILVMYRVTIMRSKDLFLITYYDSFYPDLHLYTSRPDMLRHSMLSTSRTPWLSIPQTLVREGWKASTRMIWDNILIIIEDGRKLVWETWGNDPIQTGVPWPPT